MIPPKAKEYVKKKYTSRCKTMLKKAAAYKTLDEARQRGWRISLRSLYIIAGKF
ncbi:MAG: hypothetical protein KGJ13_04735 [Patescibacteria group bacterium]|nr:hypothetical protein [Patescibacteria group bacterium]